MHILETPRLQLRLASSDARRPSVGVADSRILSTAGAIVVLALCLGLVSPAALSQACAPSEVVSELFRYSQLAERPEDREDPEPCSTEETMLVADNLQSRPVPPTRYDNLENQLRELIDPKAFVDRPPNQQNTNTLHVGCKEEILGLFDVAVAVEMRFYQRNNAADVIQLDVVYRQGDGDSDWRPFIDPDSGEIMVIPGTEMDNLH